MSTTRRSSIATGMLLVSVFIGETAAQYPLSDIKNASLPWFNIRLPSARIIETTQLPTTAEFVPEIPEVPEIPNEIVTRPAPTEAPTPPPTPAPPVVRINPVTPSPAVVDVHALRSSFKWVIFCQAERKYAPWCKTPAELRNVPATGTIWASGAHSSGGGSSGGGGSGGNPHGR